MIKMVLGGQVGCGALPIIEQKYQNVFLVTVIQIIKDSHSKLS